MCLSVFGEHGIQRFGGEIRGIVGNILEIGIKERKTGDRNRTRSNSVSTSLGSIDEGTILKLCDDELGN